MVRKTDRNMCDRYLIYTCKRDKRGPCSAGKEHAPHGSADAVVIVFGPAFGW